MERALAWLSRRREFLALYDKKYPTTSDSSTWPAPCAGTGANGSSSFEIVS